jgi:rubrerythrin
MGLKELFEEAIAREQSSQEFYKNMLNYTMDPMEDRLLRWLIKQEQVHEQRLKGRYKAILKSLDSKI